MTTDPGPTTTRTITEAHIAALRAAVLGEVITAGDPGYDEARSVWNGIIDRRPTVVLRCAGVPDVVEAVAFARRHPVPVSIRGGGHQVAGSAVCDEGLVIDLSAMHGVYVDPQARTARVQAGARWSHVDRTTQLFGLATTGGEVSVTGVAGLTLGGGMGLTQRAFGLACDNLRSVEIVTADGMVRTASPQQHPDLFWAARGGGRGLGVVTSFEFELHPLGPDVAAAQVLYDARDAERCLRTFRNLAIDAPDSVSPEAALWTVPPIPDLPQELHGRRALLVAALYTGDPADAEAVLAPYRKLATPMLDMTEIAPYVALQSAFDFFFPDGGRYYFKSHFTDDLDDEAIATIADLGTHRPNDDSFLVIRTLGGAISRIGPDESAYPHRNARLNISIDCVWTNATDDEHIIGWARSAWERLRPFSNGGVYLNFAGLEGGHDVPAHATFGPSLARLEQVRLEYDPDGVFAGASHRP